MNTSVIQNTNALTKVPEFQVLREGSSVFIRILSKNDTSSYTASLNGKRILVKSELPLQVGQGYKATVGQTTNIGERSQLLLKLEGQKITDFTVVAQTKVGFLSDGMIENPQLAAWFRKNGMAPDNLSFELFNEMKKLGMKFQPFVLRKARNLGKSFNTHQKQAAIAALIMEHKGLRPSRQSVKKLLNDVFSNSEDEDLDEFYDVLNKKLDGNGSFSWEHQKSKHDLSFAKAKSEQGLGEIEVGNVFKSFFAAFLENGVEKKCGNPSVLALFNHTGFSLDKPVSGGTWIRIPFNFDYTAAKKQHSSKIFKSGDGALVFYFDSARKKIEEIVTFFDFGVTAYRFVLYFHENKVNKIKFSRKGDFLESSVKDLGLSALADKLECSDFETIPWSDDDDFYALQSNLFSVDGSV